MSNTQVATRDGEAINEAPKEKPFEKFKNTLNAQKAKIEMVLPAHITFEKFQSVVMMACMSNPALLQADRASLLFACTKAATDGLFPDGREAQLVIFQGKLGYKDDANKDVYGNLVQYMPMYYGILKKVRQSGELSAIKAEVVYEADKRLGKFRYALGDEDVIVHEPYLGPEERGPIIAAYAIAKLKDASIMRMVMSKADIDKVRRTSKSGSISQKDIDNAIRYKKPVPVLGEPKGIWKDWEEEMSKKTVFRRLAKWLPQSTDKGSPARVFDNDDTMDVIDDAVDTSYTKEDSQEIIEGADNQGAIEHIRENQPDIAAALEASIRKDGEKVRVVENQSQPVGTMSVGTVDGVVDHVSVGTGPADDDVFPGDRSTAKQSAPAQPPEKKEEVSAPTERSAFDVELEIRGAIKNAVSAQELDEAMGEKHARDLERIKTETPAAHATIIALINHRMDELNKQ